MQNPKFSQSNFAFGKESNATQWLLASCHWLKCVISVVSEHSEHELGTTNIVSGHSVWKSDLPGQI